MRILVGVPTLNGPDRLRRCLTSIAECTRLLDVSVLVHDDASTEQNLKLNKDVVHSLSADLPGIEMLMSSERGGIPKAWNKLVRHAPADMCVLLNDDVEVVPDWLDVMVSALVRNPSVGMVGLTAYVALTKAQHALLDPFAPSHVARPVPDYRESRLQDAGGRLLASQGHAFAFRRSDFDAVGGFDERYFCFYEELDFGVSLRARGFRCVMSDYPIVYHMGGATTSDAKNMDAVAVLAASRAAFHHKWGATLDELRAHPMPPREPLWEWSSAEWWAE